MKNKKSLDFFSNLATVNDDPKAVKINKANDFTVIDSEFILKYADKNSSILDLASGSGLIVNKISSKVKEIVAVELFPEFSKHIEKSPNLEVINSDISEFKTDKKFDLVTLFGIVQYFNKAEITPLYEKYKSYLHSDGVLIVKNQFGVKEDVVIDGYSDELKTNYYSEYRFLEAECDLLREVGFNNIEVIDIYPSEFNRWDNTHFYALVCTL